MDKSTKKQANKNPQIGRQISAFKKTARELECDESEKAFDKALGKIAKAKVPKRDQRRG